MAELLLVANPKRRRRRRKMTAKQRKYFGKRRSHRRRKHAVVAVAPRRRRRRRHTGVARRRRARPSGARAAQGYVVGTKRIRRLKLNPHRRHHRRRHRNPFTLGGVTSAFLPTLKAGGWGAAGGLANDAGWGFVSSLITTNLPTVATYLTNPYVGFLAKAFNAVLIGRLGGMVASGRAQQLAVGAMTCVVHDFLKTTLESMMPTVFGTGGTLALGGLGDPDPGLRFGAYISGLGGSAPIVGTLTNPNVFSPGRSTMGPFGAYYSGAGGGAGAGDTGVFQDDSMGEGIYDWISQGAH